MDYIRDYYEDTIYKANKIVKDLNNIFREYNKKKKYYIKLYNPKFEIEILNSKEIFDKFYIRFTTAIVPLNFPKGLKVE
ncbi:hypothetical protein ACLMJK_005586 [Lecanora helva]